VPDVWKTPAHQRKGHPGVHRLRRQGRDLSVQRMPRIEDRFLHALSDRAVRRGRTPQVDNTPGSRRPDSGRHEACERIEMMENSH